MLVGISSSSLVKLFFGGKKYSLDDKLCDLVAKQALSITLSHHRKLLRHSQEEILSKPANSSGPT